MNERLLQYIWQFQYFNKKALLTAEGDMLEVIYAGTYNTNQGPDFLDAKIKIAGTTWAGNIELHVKASDWQLHKHTADNNYKSVILHVVWENDIALNNNIPALELEGRTSPFLLDYYSRLMNTNSFIACEKNITQVSQLVWLSWKERLLAERLQRKAALVFELQQKNNNHWEETFWWLLARNFGVKVNSEAFEKIAMSIPINILAKHKNQLHQVEALLFGQAGLLEAAFTEAYPKLLQKEYQFLKTKYQLQKVYSPVYFLRMRPAAFPTVRLAQLAMLVHKSQHLFTAVKESHTLKEVRYLLNVTANDYWHYHYVFDQPTAFKEKNLGSAMTDLLIINTVVPMLYAYGSYHKEDSHKQKAQQWLGGLAAEKNNITRGFSELQVENSTAFDSQSLIQLKNEYCNKKQCLDCAVGNALLKAQKDRNE